jgi:pyruvate formate lyase activating enzyme
MKEAMFYTKTKDLKVRCSLCPRSCFIPQGCKGFCSVRLNRKGRLFSLVYGKAIAVHVDPIEKKPLFHFAPGTQCLSFSTVGCNLDCGFCQNWEISHPENISGEDIPPEKIIGIAQSYGVPGISYTYTEPTIFYEYAYETMKLARKAGLYNIWVSNGYTSPEPIKKAARYLDAINVDIKGSPEFYRKICRVPDNRPVFKSLKLYKKLGVFIEVTNLLVPKHNDSDRDIKELVSWVKSNLGEETPVHFSRFHPDFRLRDAPPTPTKTLEKAYGIARRIGLRWVYIGNVPGHERENTQCPECGDVLISRSFHKTDVLKKKCKCGKTPPIAGEKWIKL